MSLDNTGCILLLDLGTLFGALVVVAIAISLIAEAHP